MGYTAFEKEVNKILDENLKNTTKDVSWDTYTVFGETKSYPFWKSVVASPSDTYKDFLEWAAPENTKEGEDLVGIVKPPKPEFDVDSAPKPTVVTDFSVKLENKPAALAEVPELKEFEDKTGAVKPKEDMGKDTVPEAPKAKAPKASKGDPEDMTGIVEPKSDFGGKAKPIIDNDFSKPTESLVISDWNETLLDKFKKLKIAD